MTEPTGAGEAKPGKTKLLAIEVDEAYRKRVKNRAAQYDMTVKQLVESLLDDWLKTHPPKEI